MFRARLGVRTRILAIALVPSLTLLVVGVGAAGYLVAEGNKAKDWAAQNQQAIPAARELLEAVQGERAVTLAALTGDETLTPTLGAARMRLDSALKGLLDASAGLREVDDSKIGDNAANFTTLTASMTQVRTLTDAGTLPVPDAYNFYNRLLDIFTFGTELAEQSAPDAEIGVHIADSMRIFLVVEAMSRSTALAGMIANANGPTPIPMEEFLREIGFYHAEAANLAGELDRTQRESLQTLTTSQAWQQLTAMENALAQRNTSATSTTSSSSSSSSSTTKQATPPALPLSTQEWHSAAAEVNRGLIDVWITQSKYSQQLAEEKADDATARSAWAGGGVVVVSLLAFLIAILLANRVINRLERLRGETLALADERLPELMRRLGEGELIDPEAESAELDYGHDEIGQVAKAFQHAHAAAVAGAVTEARTREGVKAVFLNIAHRSQIVVHRQLEILDKAEERQEDPVMLDTLFRLDHLATRERRNAENLIILAGGQPGRQWRNPVPLIDLVRSAVGETLDYARVRVSRLPETHVHGAVVADLIHLLAELVDNATSFSPPQSRVEVSGNVVGKGVVTEISDQGMGMAESEIARVNEMLRKPPDFGVAALSSDSRLGLFVVAQLATRHGVSIRLTESDYGGIRAIVLIPSALLADEPAALTTGSEQLESARRRRHPVPFVDSSPFGGAETESAVLTAPALASPAIESSAPRPAFEAPQPTAADTRPALPRRNRQASIAPQLTQPTVVEPEAEESQERERSAEQARDLMSAIENGTRQGRRAVPDAVQPEVAAAEQFGTYQGPSGRHSDEQEGNGDFFQPR
ncbi:nitrate- and nitrite sensing domain-containing protein [Nocardia vinacea]|uniref:histidine kinase n=1 Tax=Nocardia vinacea TaxID=96468 RepID=A0ABZ1YW00_9NOCA|nr:nitrate- and nitrite sensing domain-containing protein [Nocardia vinacea]